MDTSPVDLQTAAAIEAAEARAWADLYAAAPADFAEEAGVRTQYLDGTLVLSWAATGRRYFSRTIGLGVTTPATRGVIDAILDGYAAEGITMFLLQGLPHCRPAAFGDWLVQRGLEAFDAQDRVVRGGEPYVPRDGQPLDRDLVVERVGPDATDEWAEFLQRVYRLDTGPWLQQLIGRPGWHQYVAREHGTIVGARGMFINRDGRAWWGMDGPVPGVMTDAYEPDAAICSFMVQDGLAHGARMFLADIEAP